MRAIICHAYIRQQGYLVPAASGYYFACNCDTSALIINLILALHSDAGQLQLRSLRSPSAAVRIKYHSLQACVQTADLLQTVAGGLHLVWDNEATSRDTRGGCSARNPTKRNKHLPLTPNYAYDKHRRIPDHNSASDSVPNPQYFSCSRANLVTVTSACQIVKTTMDY
jgi:hypothetical protein